MTTDPIQQTADQRLRVAVSQMVADGVSDEMTIDRLLTFGAGLSVMLYGGAHTVDQLREMASRVAGGAFAALEVH